MNKVTARVCTYIASNWLPVLLTVMMAILLGSFLATLHVLWPHELALLAGTSWLCAAIYLRFVSPNRQKVPPGVTAFFAGVALGITATTGGRFLGYFPPYQGRIIQTSAYLLLAFMPAIALLIVMYAVNDELSLESMSAR